MTETKRTIEIVVMGGCPLSEGGSGIAVCELTGDLDKLPRSWTSEDSRIMVFGKLEWKSPGCVLEYVLKEDGSKKTLTTRGKFIRRMEGAVVERWSVEDLAYRDGQKIERSRKKENARQPALELLDPWRRYIQNFYGDRRAAALGRVIAYLLDRKK